MIYCVGCKTPIQGEVKRVSETYYGQDNRNNVDGWKERWRTIRKPYHPDCVPEVEE